jgi:hypothetical protein
VQDTLPQIRIKDPIWQAWHVEMSPLGNPMARHAPPSHMLIAEETLARSPLVALEEHLNGDKFVEIIGVRFQVIGYDSGSRLFGLRRTV